MVSSPSPLGGADRIETLDVLRGFALFGILVLNIQVFAMPSAAYVNPTASGPLTGADFWIWFFSHVLFAEKFIAIFTMLFGAGIVLMTERAGQSGGSATRLHYRRMGWLALIGLVHAYLIWFGDILFIYALCGMAAIWGRNWPLRRLLIVAAILFAVPTLAGALFTWGFSVMPADTLAEVEAASWGGAVSQAEIAAYRGNWIEQMDARVPAALSMHLFLFPTEYLWRTIALMLTGMAMYRSGFLGGAWTDAAYRRTAMICLGLGLPLVLTGVWANFAAGWEMTFSLYYGRMFNVWASPLVATGWIALVVLAARRFPMAMHAVFATVGRTALSNYLLQSLVCTTIFYGHGLGLFGTVDRTGQIGVVLAMWVAMPVWSALWLRRFRFGPAEWLWRSLTYGKAQPLLRAAR